MREFMANDLRMKYKEVVHEKTSQCQQTRPKTQQETLSVKLIAQTRPERKQQIFVSSGLRWRIHLRTVTDTELQYPVLALN